MLGYLKRPLWNETGKREYGPEWKILNHNHVARLAKALDFNKAKHHITSCSLPNFQGTEVYIA
jgi:hypothetical protein